MTDSSTLISELNNTPSSDGDLVKKIMSDMNISPGQEIPRPSVYSMRDEERGGAAPSSSNSTINMSLDPQIPTAHLIGNTHPTSQDFANLVATDHGASIMRNSMNMNPLQPDKGQDTSSSFSFLGLEIKGGKGIQFIQNMFYQFKSPLLVFLIVILINLPSFHTLMARYISPSLFLDTNYSIVRNIIKAVVAGGLFWIIQTLLFSSM